MIQEEGEVQVIEFTLFSYFEKLFYCVPFIVKYPKAYYFVSATVEYVTLPSFPSLLSVSA